MGVFLGLLSVSIPTVIGTIIRDKHISKEKRLQIIEDLKSETKKASV